MTFFKDFPEGFDESPVILHPSDGHSGKSGIAPYLSWTNNNPLLQKSPRDLFGIFCEVERIKLAWLGT